MHMFDWVALAIVVALMVRGWRRGAVREAIDAALLLFGTLLVFRLSPALGVVISGMASVPSEVGRVLAGVLVFLVLVVGSFLVGRIIAAAMKIVPGASTLNRLGGAVAGLVFAVIVIVLGTTLLSAAPMPSSIESAFHDAVNDSAIGRTVVNPSGVTQDVVSLASGQQIYGSVIAVREAVGERLSAGTLPIPLPSVDDADLTPSQSFAQTVFDELNIVRISEGRDPLAWSPDLAIVAVARANAVYRSGVLSLDDDLPLALAAAGIPGTIHAELVVIGASPDGIVEAVVDTEPYVRLVTDGTYTKAGIGLVKGPYGLVAVQVLSG